MPLSIDKLRWSDTTRAKKLKKSCAPKCVGTSKTVFGTVKEYTLEKRRQKYEAASTSGNRSRFRYTSRNTKPSTAGGSHLNISLKENESVDGLDGSIGFPLSTNNPPSF